MYTYYKSLLDSSLSTISLELSYVYFLVMVSIPRALMLFFGKNITMYCSGTGVLNEILKVLYMHMYSYCTSLTVHQDKNGML